MTTMDVFLNLFLCSLSVSKRCVILFKTIDENSPNTKNLVLVEAFLQV